MKTFSVFLCALLPFYVSATGQSVETKFRKYFSRSLSGAPLRLDDASFADLTGPSRDYSVVALLTAMPAQFGCQLCREFQPEFNIVARSWISGDTKGDSKVLFGVLDFPDGKSTFQQVRNVSAVYWGTNYRGFSLNFSKMMLQTAPVLYLFPPKTGPGAKADVQPIRMDFKQGFVPLATIELLLLISSRVDHSLQSKCTTG